MDIVEYALAENTVRDKYVRELCKQKTGLNYFGSKNNELLAKTIRLILDTASTYFMTYGKRMNRFYDCFGGGGNVSLALPSGFFNEIVLNDLDKDIYNIYYCIKYYYKILASAISSIDNHSYNTCVYYLLTYYKNEHNICEAIKHCVESKKYSNNIIKSVYKNNYSEAKKCLYKYIVKKVNKTHETVRTVEQAKEMLQKELKLAQTDHNETHKVIKAALGRINNTEILAKYNKNKSELKSLKLLALCYVYEYMYLTTDNLKTDKLSAIYYIRKQYQNNLALEKPEIPLEQKPDKYEEQYNNISQELEKNKNLSGLSIEKMENCVKKDVSVELEKVMEAFVNILKIEISNIHGLNERLKVEVEPGFIKSILKETLTILKRMNNKLLSNRIVLKNVSYKRLFEMESLLYLDSLFEKESLLYLDSLFEKESLLYLDSLFEKESLLYLDSPYHIATINVEVYAASFKRQETYEMTKQLEEYSDRIYWIKADYDPSDSTYSEKVKLINSINSARGGKSYSEEKLKEAYEKLKIKKEDFEKAYVINDVNNQCVENDFKCLKNRYKLIVALNKKGNERQEYLWVSNKLKQLGGENQDE